MKMRAAPDCFGQEIITHTGVDTYLVLIR